MPPAILQQLHDVTLAGGASTTLAHVLTDALRPLVPNVVMPDRGTPIRVTNVTATGVTYENTDPDNEQTAAFRVQFDHTVQQATNQPDNAPLNFYYRGNGVGGGSTGLLFNFAASAHLVAPGDSPVGVQWAPIPPSIAVAPIINSLQLPADAEVIAVTWDARVADTNTAYNIDGVTNVAWAGSTPTSVNLPTDGTSGGSIVFPTPWEWFQVASSINVAFLNEQAQDVFLRLMFWARFLTLPAPAT